MTAPPTAPATTPATVPATASIPVRHPLDPEPVRSTKTTAVLVLGILAVATGPLVGGIVPAVLALVLARPARAELLASGGFLSGGQRLRRGEVLAMIGLGLATVTLVIAAAAALLAIAKGGGHDFPDTVD